MSVTLKSNEFWGKRSGSYDPSIPKGSNKPRGNVFTQSQWGSGANNNTPKKRGISIKPLLRGVK